MATIEPPISPSSFRLPSTRPIDRRWDRSRGIVFGHAARSALNEQAKSAVHDVCFIPASSSTRSYSSRSLGSSISDPWKTSGFNSSGEDVQRLTIQIQSLTENNEKLSQMIKSLKTDVTTKKAELVAARANVVIAERQTVEAQAVTQRRVEAAEARSAAEKAILQEENTRLVAELDPYRTQKAQVLATAREEMLPSMEQDYEQKRKQIENHYEKRINELESQYAKRIDELENQHKALEKERSDLEETTRNLTDTLSTLTRTVDQEVTEKNNTLTAAQSHVEDLEQQLKSRQQRGASDRGSYDLYRSIFADFRNEVYELANMMNAVELPLQTEARLWRTAKTTFETSKELELFRGMHKYQALRSSIISFVEAQVNDANAARKDLDRIRNSVISDFGPLRGAAHLSRMITRYHHLGEEYTNFESMNLMLTLSVLGPLREVRADCRAQGEVIKRKLRQAEKASDYSVVARLRLEHEILRDTGIYWTRLLNIIERGRQLESYKALLNDGVTEKAMFLRFREVDEKFRQTSDEFHRAEDEATNSAEEVDGKFDREYHLGYRELDATARSAFDEWRNTVKRSILLENDLGLLTLEQQDEATEEIQRRITRTKVEVDAAMESVRPRPGTTRLSRADLRSPGPPPITRGAEASPKASKSEIATSAHTAQPRRARRSFRASSRSPHQHHPEASIGRLRMKQTSPLQAQYTRPSFDMCSLHVHPQQNYPDLMATGSESVVVVAKNADDTPWTSLMRSSHADIVPVSMESSSSGTTAVTDDFDSAFDAVLDSTEHESRQQDNTSGTEKLHDRQSIIIETSTSKTELRNQLSESIAALAVETHDSKKSSIEPALEVAPLPTLSYQIPAEDYRDAVMASSSSSAAYWSHRLYKNSDGACPVVLYCTSYEKAEEQAKLFLDQPILGFDLEWEPRSSSTSGIKQNLSLLQLASEDKIGLFHIALFSGDTAEKLLPPTLKVILEASATTKAGVNIRGDATRLEKWLGVEMQGMFELSHMFKVVKYPIKSNHKVNFRPVSMADQVQEVLLLPLKKDENRTSAWSRRLNAQQTHYAASDAYAGFRLFHALDAQRSAMVPMPPRPDFLESNQPLILADGSRIVRSERKYAVRQADGSATVRDDAEDDAEEFFDAVEELETCESASVVAEAPQDAEIPLQSRAAEDGAANRTWNRSSEIVFAPNIPSNDESEDVSRSPSSVTQKGRSTEPRPTRPETPEVQLADMWLDSFLAVNTKVKANARPNELRAYHLWHEQGYEPKAVAAFLKAPPLSVTTVASYVLQAVHIEDLPYDADRMRNVVNILPQAVHRRYWKIIDDVRLSR